MFLKSAKQQGFTLVEIMVAVSIFAIVSVITIGALVSANNLNRKSQAIKLVMDNLNFALSSMTLKMKQGGGYYCYINTSGLDDDSPDYPTDLTQNCSSGGEAIAFFQNNVTPTRQYIYRYHEVGTQGILEYSQGEEGGAMGPFVRITAPEIDLDELKFYVVGSYFDPEAELVAPQPRVLISLYGEAVSGAQRSDFAIQTSISDRR